MNIEIEFASLAEAYANGPQAIIDRCVSDKLRLLSSPTYCEREGRGVLSAEVAPSVVALVMSSLVPDDSIADAIKRGLEHHDSPAASVADQPEIDQ